MPLLAVLAALTPVVPPSLEASLRALAKGFDGRVGIAVVDGGARASVNGDARFSMQSVMKLVVGVAALDAVDRGAMGLYDPIVIRREDLSVSVQPLAILVGPTGFRTTVADLVRRAVAESDSTATDVLFARVGGAKGIAALLARKGIRGIRVDRDERHLQTETTGLAWRPDFVDSLVYEKAVAGIPPARRLAAFNAYRKDVRDTATPNGIADLLDRLARGKLLSKASGRYLRSVMVETETFPDRLQAGLPKGWTLGHKTGTSPTVGGITAATNDVGILTGPNGRTVVVAVFVADSRRPAPKRAALIAAVARRATRRG